MSLDWRTCRRHAPSPPEQSTRPDSSPATTASRSRSAGSSSSGSCPYRGRLTRPFYSSPPRCCSSSPENRCVTLGDAPKRSVSLVVSLDPPSDAGRHPEAAPHSRAEGSPCGRAHPLLETEGFFIRSAPPERLVGRGRPDEPCELAGERDDDLLARLAASLHPAADSARRARPRAGPARADGGRAWYPPCGRAGWFQAASTSRRRRWELPALVIDPCLRLSPEERSEGTRPT